MRTEVNGKMVEYDVEVTVPYSGIEEDGEVTFYLKSEGGYMRQTYTSPAEYPYWETVEIEGAVLDDDLPDLEDEAHARADEETPDAETYWGI